MRALLQTINIAASAGAAMKIVQRADAVAGRGLQGDRYYSNSGTFSGRMQVATGARELSLIDASAVEICSERLGRNFAATELRRNLVIEGLDDLLIGRTALASQLQIGDVQIRIVSTCPPCGYLSRLLAADMRKGLRHIGGYRAAIKHSGELLTGMSVVILD